MKEKYNETVAEERLFDCRNPQIPSFPEMAAGLSSAVYCETTVKTVDTWYVSVYWQYFS